jgi:hypothetical protein
MLGDDEPRLFTSSPESGIPEVCRCGTSDGIITESFKSAEMGKPGPVELWIIIVPVPLDSIKMDVVKTAFGGRARTTSRFPDHDSELGSERRELVKG